MRGRGRDDLECALEVMIGVFFSSHPASFQWDAASECSSSAGWVMRGVALATGEWGWVITDFLGAAVTDLFGARQSGQDPAGSVIWDLL
jgi:hypothetical protein